jgi:hypothetical protein
LKKLLLIFLLHACISTGAQTKDLPDSLRQVVWAARLHDGFIFAHNIHVQNTKGTHPYGFELEYSHLRTDPLTVEKYKCYPRSGFSFTYVDFNKDFLGRSYSLSYFLEPNFRLGNALKMNVRGAAGFSYLTNPYDSIKNPDNQSYSGHINSFLQLGVGLSYPLSKHLAIYALGNFFHNSNGGFKLPNAGVNYINASIGLQYNTYSTRLPAYKKEKDTSWKQEPVHYDLSLYYSPKGGYNGTADNYKASRKFVAGISFQVAKRVSNLDAITASAEVYYDDALRSIKQIFIADSASSNVLAGFLIGHQFLFNHFTFSQEFGVYVFKDTKKYDDIYQDLFHPFYQRWSLSYRLKKHWSVGVSLLAHYQIADYVDGRVIYRFR